MSRVLITGASGNIGSSVIKYLVKNGLQDSLIAADRNPESLTILEKQFGKLAYRRMDFEDVSSFGSALVGIKTVFLLRPPQLADVEKYFRPFISEMKKQGVLQIVFLSVQGAEKSKVIPHNKIEQLIHEYQLDYIFLRPGYFMQNLTTLLLQDIKNENRIFLPAGKAKFNWVDVENIGEFAATVINRFNEFKNQAFEITGTEQLNFGEVSEMLSKVINKKIYFVSPNLFRFYLTKRKQGVKQGMILVMIMLHFLPRIQKQSSLTDNFQKIIKKQPTLLYDFLVREKDIFTKSS